MCSRAYPLPFDVLGVRGSLTIFMHKHRRFIQMLSTGFVKLGKSITYNDE